MLKKGLEKTEASLFKALQIKNILIRESFTFNEIGEC